jgi:hypothetical protein
MPDCREQPAQPAAGEAILNPLGGCIARRGGNNSQMCGVRISFSHRLIIVGDGYGPCQSSLPFSRKHYPDHW